MTRLKRLPASLRCLLAAAVLASPAFAITDALTDDPVAQMLAKRLERRGLDEVDVRVNGSTAVLVGTVDTLRHRDEAERVASSFEEIESVDNQIELVSNDRVQADIVADVSRKLSNPTWHTVFDWIEAEVEGSAVRLHGAVTMPWKEQSAIRAMQSIPGVDSVMSTIEVLPVSIHDDQIRQRAYEAIYGDLSFAEYANRLEPPIHIVVDQGDVRLEGSVRNRAEKMLARSLVSSSALAFDIENNLQTSTDQPR
ncbi:MAG TPA: BON domain-containing protein [Thermoanaerobaculia bacterium]|nr:BON domain-containing protein [Thermoanaerobaculia bacterium]